MAQPWWQHHDDTAIWEKENCRLQSCCYEWPLKNTNRKVNIGKQVDKGNIFIGGYGYIIWEPHVITKG
jgi:hypothetical protein